MGAHFFAARLLEKLVSNAKVLFDAWQWQNDDALLHALPI